MPRVPHPTSPPAVAARDYHMVSALTTDRLLYIAQQFLGFETMFIAALTDSAMHVLETLHLPTAQAVCRLDGPISTPLEHTYCQFVFRSGQPLVVPDARNLAPYADLPTTHDLNIGAYVGVPLITHAGAIIGTLCGIDPAPQTVSHERLALLQMVAKALMHQFEMEDALTQAEAAMVSYAELRDAATGLPAREAFEHALQAEVIRAAMRARSLSLVLMRLRSTETQLEQWSTALIAQAQDYGAAFWFDPTTLAILMPDCGYDQASARLAANPGAAVAVGLAAYPEQAANLADLLQRALTALESARTPGLAA